jgi:mRNA interferase RelE/StbE
MSKKVVIIYSPIADRDLMKLGRYLAERIACKIEENASQEHPLLRAKPLTGVLSDKYRYRIGDYRAVFSIAADGTITLLTILSVKHRKDVYR